MKRTFLFALASLLMLGFVSCSKDDDNNSANGNNALVGTWKFQSVNVNGQDMTSMVGDAQIVLNANGAGTINVYSNDYSFTWTYSGNTLVVNNGNDNINCTVVSLTNDRCTLTSSNMVFPGVGPVQGEVTIVLVRVGGGSSDNNYSSLILGNWQITAAMLNGEDMVNQMGSMVLSFYDGGTGLISHNGETENNDFGWSISGSTITITPRGGSYNYTITALNASTCTFTGTVFPITGQQGNVSITMNRVVLD